MGKIGNSIYFPAGEDVHLVDTPGEFFPQLPPDAQEDFSIKVVR